MNPTSEAELSNAIATASGPVTIRGGGTRAGLGGPVDGDTLDVSGISGISLYEPGALTMVAAAGTPLSEIETALQSEKQQLAFEPMDHRALYGGNGSPTIGGVVAGNISGPRRIQTGACRDHMLGVRFVDGSGRIVKNGGRVMKNVTGYDLVKLMTGSHGTLGVLTEVSFKVLPKPETVGTVRIRGLSDADAVAAMSSALTSPFDINGAAHLPQASDGQAETLIRVEGFAASVSERCSKLQDRLGRIGGDISVETDQDRNARDWAAIRDAESIAQGTGDVWRVSVRPTDGPAVAKAAGAEAHFFDWGGGLVWLRLPADTDLRARLAGIAGHATLIRADAQTRRRLGAFHPEAPAISALSDGLRQKFNPRGILNPGRMG